MMHYFINSTAPHSISPGFRVSAAALLKRSPYIITPLKVGSLDLVPLPNEGSFTYYVISRWVGEGGSGISDMILFRV